MLKKYDQAERICDFDVTKCIEDYFARHNEPINIKDDGRVKVTD